MRFLALFICYGVASAQIANLTTNADGSTVWFDTPLPRKTIDEPEQGRIYRLDAAGLQLIASTPRRDPSLPSGLVPLPPNTYFTNYFDLHAPQSGRDTLLYQGRAICFRCTPAGTSLTIRYTLTNTNGILRTGMGEARLSRNGRYILASSGFPYESYIVDTEDPNAIPATATTSTAPAAGSRIIADNGTAVLPGFNGVTLQLLTPAKRTEVRIPSASDYAWFYEPSIDASGKAVLYTLRGIPGPITLRIFRLDDRRDTHVHTCQPRCESTSINADGDTVYFLENQQLTRADAATAQSRRLTNEPHGVLRYTASDDGKVAWYVNGMGQLRRLDTASGGAETYIESTPALTNTGALTLTPGSLATLTGEGLSSAAAQAQHLPLPTQLANTTVSVNGIPSPIHSISPTSITIQTPWNAPAAPLEVKLETTSNSPFRATARATFPAEAIAPAFLPLQPGIYAIHETFDALVTSDNPARPGEYIHLYATGLGPVTLPVETGAASPLNATLRNTINCTTPIVFAGLAPTLVGIYQITVRVAASDRGEGFLTCQVASKSAFAAFPILR
ncbi:MAG: IPT/TIG domain-containing protein [Acidobacteria bacterium]|nr:IPT/TIG domain-containing protein [Acidobacteriota bacterium]